MAGLDETTLRADSSDAPRTLESGTEYRIDHELRSEVVEASDNHLESAEYRTRGFKGEELHEFRSHHEGEFIEPMSRSYPVEKFDSPDKVVSTINPRYEDQGNSHKVNCADCARSVERTWRGNHEEAAGRSPRVDAAGRLAPHGEQSQLTEEWAGERFSEAPDDARLRQVLLDGEHGSSAIVHSTWERDAQQRAGGHAYNAVNYHGEIRVLDGQVGSSFEWQSGDIHPQLGRNPEHRAIAWDAEGNRIW